MGTVQGLIAKIKKALARAGNTHTILDVTDALQSGRAQAFTKNESMLVTEIIQTHAAKVMHIWLVVGDMEDVVELQREACAAAREFGCTKATFHGRKGWQRHPATAQEGWEPLYIGYIKDLTGE